MINKIRVIYWCTNGFYESFACDYILGILWGWNNCGCKKAPAEPNVCPRWHNISLFSREICFMASFTTICGNNPSQTSGGPWKRRVVSREKTQAPGKRPDLCAKRVRLWYQTNHSRYISFRSMVNGYLLIVERSFGKRMRTTHLHMIC